MPDPLADSHIVRIRGKAVCSRREGHDSKTGEGRKSVVHDSDNWVWATSEERVANLSKRVCGAPPPQIGVEQLISSCQVREWLLFRRYPGALVVTLAKRSLGPHTGSRGAEAQTKACPYLLSSNFKVPTRK